MKRYWWLPLLLVVLFALAWWVQHAQRPSAERLPVDQQCDLATAPCELRLPDGARVQIALAPLPPKALLPLTLTLRSEAEITAAWVDVVGVDMEMGVSRSELVGADKGLWQGRLVLPICSSTRMHWEARLYLQREQGLIEAPLHFSTRP